jgi:hypothetical protein
LKITPDRHNAGQKLNHCLLPAPPHFSLPSTFKTIVMGDKPIKQFLYHNGKYSIHDKEVQNNSQKTLSPKTINCFLNKGESFFPPDSEKSVTYTEIVTDKNTMTAV